MRSRAFRLLLILLVIAAAAPLVPSPDGMPSASAAGTIRWGYYVTYNPDSLASLKANAANLTHVSPYYYSLKADGTIDTRNEQAETTAFLRARGIKILPMISTNAQYDAFHALIDTPEKQDRLVAALVTLVTTKNYDGIQIDFEGLNPTDRALLADFMRRLHARLQPVGKLTTMAVAAKASDTKTGWGGVYDYAALAPHVDLVVLMAYDFHYQNGKTPGAIAPTGWVRSVAKFGASHFGVDKTLLGIPLYGMDWNTTKGPPARALRMADGPTLAKKPGATSGYSAVDEANWVRYTDEAGEAHEAWFEDERSIAAKLAIMTDLGLAGFATWRLGQEDGGAWAAIEKLVTPATRVAPVPNTATQHYFPETGQVVQGAFLRYWQQYGGLAQFGLPRTREFQERSPYDNKLYTVQYFERARFEHHPENSDPQYQVLLGLLGRDFHRPDPPAPPKEGAAYFASSGHNLSGPFRDYWVSHGGLFVSGLPITEEFTEINPEDGKSYTVQYFERARYEYHPENAAPFNVLLGLLGNQIVRDKGWIP
ncbi:MAG TPA: glycosyl hydrolase family 18 protein [Thermomicrobiales bacterium]|jgi:spore germination protein YaaH